MLLVDILIRVLASPVIDRCLLDVKIENLGKEISHLGFYSHRTTQIRMSKAGFEPANTAFEECEAC